ncbi:MAG: DUF1697 domain-containing protein [Gemmatimonadaceae bacterium]
MTRYIAFLRAINVGGHTVKMERLRALFEARKLRNVETFIASGNVIFDARSADAALVEREIERHLERELGYEVPTFLRTPAELAAAAGHCPFDKRAVAGAYAVYVGFVRSPLSDDAEERVAAFRSDIHDFHVQGRELHWLSRVSVLESKVSAARLERAIGAPMTLRNVTTVRKLAARHAGV